MFLIRNITLYLSAWLINALLWKCPFDGFFDGLELNFFFSGSVSSLWFWLPPTALATVASTYHYRCFKKSSFVEQMNNLLNLGIWSTCRFPPDARAEMRSKLATEQISIVCGFTSDEIWLKERHLFPVMYGTWCTVSLWLKQVRGLFFRSNYRCTLLCFQSLMDNSWSLDTNPPSLFFIVDWQFCVSVWGFYCGSPVREQQTVYPVSDSLWASAPCKSAKVKHQV